MNVSEVKISLFHGADEQLLAFCTVTFDRAFVVRDVRIIQGANGPFVAMPSRRVTTNCGKCHAKNYLGSKFCAECGNRLPLSNQAKLPDRNRGFVDIAHPINAKSRERIQSAILEAYAAELAKSQQPGYRPDSLEADVAAPQHANPPHWNHERQSTPEQTE